MLFYKARRQGLASFDMVGSRRKPGRLPSVVRALPRAPLVSRMLYLEALGVGIMPDLTGQEVEALEQAGAIVLTNDVVTQDSVETLSIATPSFPSKHLQAVAIEEARKRGLFGTGVTIGILDSGIDPKHPEFEGKTIHFKAFPYGFKQSKAYRFTASGSRTKIDADIVKDYGEHGTQVAALCAGYNVGVAPNANLAVAAVLTESDGQRMVGSLAQVVQGLDWLADGCEFGVKVDLLNASIGIRESSGDDLNSLYQNLLGRRILGSLLTVAAVGNNGRAGMSKHTAPAMFDIVIGVGAVDNAGIVADFSDWGESYPVAEPASYKPDIMASGVSVQSAAPSKLGVPEARYVLSSGTSMACAITTGACALLIEQDGTLRANPTALSTAVLDLCEPLPPQPPGHDHRRGGRGRLNLARLP